MLPVTNRQVLWGTGGSGGQVKPVRRGILFVLVHYVIITFLFDGVQFLWRNKWNTINIFVLTHLGI